MGTIENEIENQLHGMIIAERIPDTQAAAAAGVTAERAGTIKDGPRIRGHKEERSQRLSPNLKKKSSTRPLSSQ